MSQRVGDLATQTADELNETSTELVEAQAQAVDEEAPLVGDTRRNIFTKIAFVWRSDDQKILTRVRAAVDRAFVELFADAIRVIDGLYEEMRVPETVDGIVQRDALGRVLWQKDSSGSEIEDWSQLTGQDIEKALLDIARLKLIIAPQLNDLLLEAVFAKHIADDAHADAYAELVDETIPGRNAYAARKSRVDKYHAFFRYYLYSHADAFMKELNNFARVLERIRYFRIDEQKR